MAESLEIMQQAAEVLVPLSRELDFDFYFKASFDKANRSSMDSFRGPGLEASLPWFENIKNTYQCKLITDIHESRQALIAGEIFDALQIPAFLCRQTDLLVSAVSTGKMVNIKKGQFMAPGAMSHIIKKCQQICHNKNLELKASITERGVTFGYGDLIVDPRSFPILAKSNAPILFDITHSTQNPPVGSHQTISGASREYAPILARSALATGYLSGFFLETHPQPSHAKSDSSAQLNLNQTSRLLKQIIPLWHESRGWKEIDSLFT